MSLYTSLLQRALIPGLGRLYNAEFTRLYGEWQTSQYWDGARIQEYQWRRFRTLLAHAAESVPFYRKHFQNAGLRLSNFQSFDDLEKLPILDREDYQRDGLQQFISDRVPAGEMIRESTSGTTGRPFAFVIDRRVTASKMARLLRENQWAGWEPGARYVRLWGEHRQTLPTRLFYAVFMRRVEIPAFTIDRDIEHIVHTFERLRPKVVEAYTSAAVHLARICRNRGRRLPPPESIIVSAETLTEQHRTLIQETLGAKVYNRYGSRDFGNLAHECRLGSLHINAESVLVELEDHPAIGVAKNLYVNYLD